MGCISSKNVVARAYSPSPTMVEISESIRASSRGHSGLTILDSKGNVDNERNNNSNIKIKKNSSKKSNGSFSLRHGLVHRNVEAEQNAVGWPPWLTAVAAEAIQGWIPLKADSFQKLEKIGQGTYSSVFRAREVETGKLFALKKVRFDNFQPESIRFMAREITILRRLDHPNIMKLEGIITSRLSNSIYLVFEYMEHDLAGLVSRPEIVFTESQIKCYMRQLLSGLEHCHMRGIMHRDIKVSNILLNNEGVLKIGDFGLANTISTSNKNPLTSRVVTLWYRPPELLMGSTSYGVSVDLWSVGCVFAELFLGKPILKGRTEVEQLHKIFKLCGSPPEEFWKKTKLPHATMFKPQTNYESSLRERCADFPETAIDLLETLLSIDSSNRGTSSSALMSEYFNTKPYACNPSNLPRYPPSKEMDVKVQEDSSRKKIEGKVREVATSRRQPRRVNKLLNDQNNFGKSSSKENMQNSSQNGHKDDGKTHLTKGRGGNMYKDHAKPAMDTMSETSQMMNVVNGNGYSVPIQVSGSTNDYTWVKRRKQDASSTVSDGSKSKISALDTNFAKGTYDLSNQRVSMDFDPAELVNAQGRRENDAQRAIRKSRFGRDK
ncbi:protein IMPAIRED IN BABA-INDUCED STERILITY 1-like [Vigna radiata var. radiata]|uniref:Protein IMPAIRED IN BABA-INDUCED STERILITY 1-like n=1 Tax=Vigna radiata var. radiata TaxID=3916 RepID=A0A3Q0ER80_VIGRR|nr:protein IMPAIRED IN BABA-INDUCED STERILITY 1-like [Vigna radiata var. radiata]